MLLLLRKVVSMLSAKKKNAYVFLLVIFISRRAPLKTTFLWSGHPVEYLSQRSVSTTITGIEPRSVLVINVTSQRTRLLKSCFHMIITIIELLLSCWSPDMETSLTWLSAGLSSVGRFCPTRSTVVWKDFFMCLQCSNIYIVPQYWIQQSEN